MGQHFFARRTRKIAVSAFAALITLSLVSMVQAKTSAIAALGASNTAGWGVETSKAWPAQLASLLKSRGYDVSITVLGVIGDTSAGILTRVSTIPVGTRVVLFDTGGYNDRQAGITDAARAANIAQIAAHIRARGAVAIMVSYDRTPPNLLQPDGLHLNAAGHARLAAKLLPRVTAALGRRN